jgi:hypothetical protein
MGADLYLNSPEHQAMKDEWDAIYERLRTANADERPVIDAQLDAVSEKMFSHPLYFRDSYNNSSLLWHLGLSWWADIPTYFGPDGYTEGATVQTCDEPVIHASGARALAAMLRERKQQLDNALSGRAHDEQAYFLDKYHRFLEMLDLCAERDLTIYASL